MSEADRMTKALAIADRIAAALDRIAEQNNGLFGLGGAAGAPDEEQLHALELIDWRLENTTEDILEMVGA